VYSPVSNFSVSQSSGKFLTDFSTFSDFLRYPGA
jgi:hypothetical protein